MARGRPRTRPVPPVVDEPIETGSTEHFSPLLWMPHREHRVSLASCELRCVHMQYYEVMDQYLINLGLYSIVDILRTGSGIINASLIARLVERWRLETNTGELILIVLT
ncbi:hypothetical protein FCM35_KLT03104 [Carex littledalei]|uniref:Uncharacterized protein n=1 Tax=Carex littledalei TaxID=544730 RepID=A0A833R1D1_9POAL|nr:hypothetical protein FCM35_KLT03104 [Carex littledalei]